MIGSLLLLVFGCDLPVPLPRNCNPRTAYYPDADGDGLGEPTAIYLGCEPPAGWVTELAPPPVDTGHTETGASHTGDTGASHTGDTGASHTGETGALAETGDTG